MVICFKFVLILSLIYNPIFASNSFAASSKVLLRSTDANEVEYANFISNNMEYVKPDPMTLSKFLLKHQSNQILNLQKLAEIEFLDDDVTKSIKTYKKIVSLALNDLWSAEVKQIIFQSYFRLAQLEKDKEGFWLQKSIDFAVDSKPDPKLTPMGLSQLHEKLLSTHLSDDQKLVKLNLSNKYLINSSVAKSALNKTTIYRIDYITEYSLPFTTYASGSKISNLKTLELKFKGLCKNLSPERKVNFTSSQLKQFANFYVFSSIKCEPTPVINILEPNMLDRKQALAEESKSSLVSDQRSELLTQSFAKSSSKVNLTGTRLKLPTSLPVKTNIEDSNEINPSSDRSLNLIAHPDSNSKIKNDAKKSNRQKTWIYVGSAILAVTLGAMFINQQNDSPRTYESTSRQGF